MEKSDKSDLPKKLCEAGLTAHEKGCWSLVFPLRFFGLKLGRRVCVFRISGDRLVIHSTGPFSSEQMQAIRKLGTPSILLEGTTMHDTFSREGRKAFAGIQYLVPEGFPRRAIGKDTRSLQELSALTDDEMESVRLEGIRTLTEYACFHRASRTLVLCDLLFNLVDASGWTRFSMRHFLGVKQWPAIDRPMRWAVRDRQAFADSIQEIFEWDFDRIMVAHGEIIEAEGKAIFREALKQAGLSMRPNA